MEIPRIDATVRIEDRTRTKRRGRCLKLPNLPGRLLAHHEWIDEHGKRLSVEVFERGLGYSASLHDMVRELARLGNLQRSSAQAMRAWLGEETR